MCELSIAAHWQCWARLSLALTIGCTLLLALVFLLATELFRRRLKGQPKNVEPPPSYKVPWRPICMSSLLIGVSLACLVLWACLAWAVAPISGESASGASASATAAKTAAIRAAEGAVAAKVAASAAADAVPTVAQTGVAVSDAASAVARVASASADTASAVSETAAAAALAASAAAATSAGKWSSLVDLFFKGVVPLVGLFYFLYQALGGAFFATTSVTVEASRVKGQPDLLLVKLSVERGSQWVAEIASDAVATHTARNVWRSADRHWTVSCLPRRADGDLVLAAGEKAATEVLVPCSQPGAATYVTARVVSFAAWWPVPSESFARAYVPAEVVTVDPIGGHV